MADYWARIRNAVKLVRAIRHTNHALESLSKAESLAQRAGTSGNYETADAFLYSSRFDLVESLEYEIPLTRSERERIEDWGLHEPLFHPQTKEIHQ